MSDKYPTAMRGVLFNNDKDGVTNRPDYNGNAELDCAHCKKPSKYWVKGWKNFAKGDRMPFISLQFEPQRPKPKPPAPGSLDFDDKIPF